MFRHPLFAHIAFVLIFIAILHITALMYDWYWIFPWLDTGLHFLGGAWIAWSTIWFAVSIARFPVESWKMREMIFVGVGAALAVGLLWEVFEVYAGVFPYIEERFPDTYYDLIADSIGGYAGVLYVRDQFFKKA